MVNVLMHSNGPVISVYRMDATQMICDSILESDEEEENANARTEPLATLRVLKNKHIPETGECQHIMSASMCKNALCMYVCMYVQRPNVIVCISVLPVFFSCNLDSPASVFGRKCAWQRPQHLHLAPPCPAYL